VSTTPGRQASSRRRRTVDDLQNLPRSAALSQLYRATEAAAPPNYPPESMFSPSSLGEWIRNYLAYLFKKKHMFPPYTASPQNAIYDLLDENGTENVRLSVAGDWGTGTNEAAAVARQMTNFKPHFTIHMGDVYYVGDPPSVNENCLGTKNPNNNYDAVTWPIGARGSFALNGNHEMYANGSGYFDVFIPNLGLRDSVGKMQGQQTSFFCLQNRYWRIIAIDTGYNSTGIRSIFPGLGLSCKLPDDLIQWLIQIVAPDKDKRGLIVMSHHQYYSSFQEHYKRPAQQLWEAGIRRPVLWFWGHEHRLAGYNLYGTDNLKSYGRCVGHGGMPVDLGTPKPGPPISFYDNRLSRNGFGLNGHVNLSFSGSELSAVYVDLDGNRLLREQWVANANGAVQLLSQEKLTEDPSFYVAPPSVAGIK
jgi:hypothetical protein